MVDARPEETQERATSSIHPDAIEVRCSACNESMEPSAWSSHTCTKECECNPGEFCDECVDMVVAAPISITGKLRVIDPKIVDGLREEIERLRRERNEALERNKAIDEFFKVDKEAEERANAYLRARHREEMEVKPLRSNDANSWPEGLPLPDYISWAQWPTSYGHIAITSMKSGEKHCVMDGHDDIQDHFVPAAGVSVRDGLVCIRDHLEELKKGGNDGD